MSRPLRFPGLAFYRAALIVAIVLMVRANHTPIDSSIYFLPEAMAPAETPRRFFPEMAGMIAPRDGTVTVLDSHEEILGQYVLTLPQSREVIGYSGPNEVFVAFDANQRIIGFEVLRSGDTPEHLAIVLLDADFMSSFNGLTWDEARDHDVDGVTQATLTSLAIAEGIRRRLGSERPSYRFPEYLTPADYSKVNIDELPAHLTVVSSPAADPIQGYQGPTQTLVGLDEDYRVRKVAIQKSYDTPEYVETITGDAFLEVFNGKTLEELATMDLEAEGIEGVSGATMTSMAVAEGIVATAKRVLEERNREPRAETMTVTVAARDVGTAVVIIMALVVSLTRLRSHRHFRMAFQLGLIVYLGFLNGDLLSQALFVGWAKSGVAWRAAPGLALMAAAALMLPLFAGRQLYCHHVCPHGAAQQLLSRVSPWKVRPSGRLARLLRLIPLALLAGVLLVAMGAWGHDLTGIEPFDAYMIGVAGGATVIVAVAGLVVSFFVPMAYCRFGCPTGAALNYVWRNSYSDRPGWRDAAAVGLLVMTVALRLAG